MARKRSVAGKRGDIYTSTPHQVLSDLLDGAPIDSLSSISDGRVWDPQTVFTPRGPLRPSRLLSGQPSRLQVPRTSPWSPLPSGVAFQQPKQVIACIRRKQRRGVLHALRKTGKGSGYGKKPRNLWSNIRCR